jgi:hypothetical protein
MVDAFARQWTRALAHSEWVPLERNQRHDQLLLHLRDAPDITVRASLQRSDDGRRCTLVLPSHAYACSLASAPAVFEAALALEPHSSSGGVDQEAVDIFVGSVVANDAGRTPLTDTLRLQLQAAIAKSSAWPRVRRH